MISSQQEFDSILAAAKRAVQHHARFWHGNEKIEDELVSLGLLTTSERYMVVDELLDELTFKAYQGPAPPNDTCSHPPYRNASLHAFCWNSTYLKKRIYFKFAVVGNKTPQLALYSLHEPRP